MPDPDRWQRLEALFDAALDLPEDAREAFVRAEAGDDPALADEVLALLAHEAAAAAAWGDSAADWGAALLDDTGYQAGQRVGAYMLEHPLGRGGMGTVWRARPADAPDGARVAVKIVRRGLDTADVRQRFRQEQRLLGALDHPGIARLLGGGVTDDGLPFVVMEYVEGEPLDAYCDRRRLGLDTRLRLFQQVCEAVHYAHQRLVVHRDLKPSNILVTTDGQIKLLDFGIAKVLQPDVLGLSHLLTRAEQRLLTPAYASPEQRLGQPVTTASDVYGLGVLLFELLTGHLPFPAPPVSDAEPPRPSDIVRQTRTTDLPDGTAETVTPDDVGEARSTAPDRLRRTLSGDLDTIALMALRREPERRYGSAAQFGDDIRRYLAGQPVAARPATVGYRVRSFVRQHRAGVAASAVALLALVAFAATMTVERNRTAREAAKAEAVAGVLAGLFDATNPMVSDGDTLTVFDVLAGSEDRLRRELADQPEVLAEVLGVIGRAYRDQTHLARADTALRDALALHQRLDPTSGGTARALNDLAALHFMQGRLDASLDVARRWDALIRRRDGTNSLDRIGPIGRIAAAHLQAKQLDSARTWLDAGYAITRPQQAAHPEAHRRLMGLEGWYFAERGDHAASVRVSREILALHRRTGAPLADIALAERILGDVCVQARDFACADSALAASQQHYRTVFGPENRYEGMVTGHLAELAAFRGDRPRAESLFAAGMRLRERHFGPDSREATDLRRARDTLLR